MDVHFLQIQAICALCDWFNPYEETQYSVGAIYLAIQNVPRTECFKVDNVIPVGLIPDPREPKSLNTYLDLLIY